MCLPISIANTGDLLCYVTDTIRNVTAQLAISRLSFFPTNSTKCPLPMSFPRSRYYLYTKFEDNWFLFINIIIPTETNARQTYRSRAIRIASLNLKQVVATSCYTDTASSSCTPLGKFLTLSTISSPLTTTWLWRFLLSLGNVDVASIRLAAQSWEGLRKLGVDWCR